MAEEKVLKEGLEISILKRIKNVYCPSSKHTDNFMIIPSDADALQTYSFSALMSMNKSAVTASA